MPNELRAVTQRHLTDLEILQFLDSHAKTWYVGEEGKYRLINQWEFYLSRFTPSCFKTLQQEVEKGKLLDLVFHLAEGFVQAETQLKDELEGDFDVWEWVDFKPTLAQKEWLVKMYFIFYPDHRQYGFTYAVYRLLPYSFSKQEYVKKMMRYVAQEYHKLELNSMINPEALAKVKLYLSDDAKDAVDLPEDD